MRYTVIYRQTVHGLWDRAEFVLARFCDKLAAIDFCKRCRPETGSLQCVDSLERKTIWER